MDSILEKPSEVICTDILEMVDNKKVNIEIDENSKNSLYVFLTNTIYISTKKNNKKNKEEQNKSRLLVIAHECAHSIQPKFMQLLNFILSNIEMILFLILVGVRIFEKSSNNVLTITYISVLLLSILIRLYLEMNATINSVKIACKYLLINNSKKEDVILLQKYYKKELLKTLPLFITYLYFWKTIRFIVAIII